jgi:hypothetical protein
MKPIRYSFFAILIATISFVSCKKQPPVEQLIVDAGAAAHIIQLPTDTVTLSGTVTSGQTANMHYLWSVVSGPVGSGFVNNTAASTLINGLVAGNYVFQFQATNSNGDIAVDTTSVLVTAQPIDTLVAQPSANPTETYAYSYAPNANVPVVNTTQLPLWAWTVGGVTTYLRSYIKFDLSQIPSTATILSAKFSIYSQTTAEFQGPNTPQYGPSDACYIQRVTSSWADATLDWNNMPTTSTIHEATIPQSTSGLEDATDIDVTALVQDMQSNGNNGFALQLINETPYNERWFTSSQDSDPTKHPKLVIIYQ